jgi:hypothetical protein
MKFNQGKNMSNKNTPAFPVPAELCQDLTVYEQRGMTLRDYFAAKAMQCYMDEEIWSADTFKIAAKCSYEVADAMLKAREA